MEIEELAAHFKGVKMNSGGFSAQCPAHPDTDPSLRVARGNTGWMVRCYSGCTFFDVAAAAGLQPLAFKYDSSPRPRLQRGDDARSKLVEMIEAKRTIPTTLGAIAEIALRPDPRVLTRVRENHGHSMDTYLPDALRMHSVTMDGAIYDLIEGNWKAYGTDWVDAKHNIGRLLWNTYVTERGHLATRSET